MLLVVRRPPDWQVFGGGECVMTGTRTRRRRSTRTAVAPAVVASSVVTANAAAAASIQRMPSVAVAGNTVIADHGGLIAAYRVPAGAGSAAPAPAVAAGLDTASGK
jgi:hypothetical protein